VGDKVEHEKIKQMISSNMTPSTTKSKSKLEMENMIMSTPTLTTNNAVETTPSVLTSSSPIRTEVDDTNNLQTIGSPKPIEPTVVSIPITTPIHKNMPSSSSSSAVKSTLAEDVLVKKSSCFC
jgi:hypothetical protein